MAPLNQWMNNDEKSKMDDDDFVVLEDPTCLPLHIEDAEKESNLDTAMPFPISEKAKEGPQADCEVLIHRVQDDGLIVKVVPPTDPVMNQSRGPVEIVLLIDVSKSMYDLAPVPPSGEGEESEQRGFTVLDLTKHAACTIAESLNEHDTLCIVTFSTDCKVLFKRHPMDTKNKKLAKEKILSMRPEYLTYLWSGMRLALDQFSHNLDMTAALMILTDGKPNEPLSNGVIAAMRRWYKDKQLHSMHVPIHTFGFGYHLKEGLLQSIAETGGGDYYFVPDASMLGTVFNHAVANLMSTYAQKATLTLEYSDVLELTELGIYIDKAKPVKALHERDGTYMEYSINLRTIQYGQSRDFFLMLRRHPDVRSTASTNLRSLPYVKATLKYQQRHEEKRAFAESDLSIDGTTLSHAERAFHYSRAMIVEFLSGLFPLTEGSEHEPLLNNRVSTYDNLQSLLSRLPANKFPDDLLNLGLIKDLIGSDNKEGQVELALQTVVEPEEHSSRWEKWGHHYLSSLLMAHQFQKCFSFKDPGTQRYGKDSQLFRDQLDMLDNLFDSLPAPLPSRPPAPPPYDTVPGDRITRPPPPSDMSQYRNVDSTCFAGHTRVLVVDPDDGTEKMIPIEKFRTGTIVKTAKGNTKAVRIVLKCHTNQTKGRTMTEIPVNDNTSLWVTPWHPLSQDGGCTWFFPAEAYPEKKYPDMMKIGFMGPVYTVQLEHQANDVANDHAINVEGLWGATMGHGLTPTNTTGKVDVRIHDFYGDWDAVAKSLDMLPKHDGLALGAGTTKHNQMSIAFLPFQGVES